MSMLACPLLVVTWMPTVGVGTIWWEVVFESWMDGMTRSVLALGVLISYLRGVCPGGKRC